MLTRLSIRNLAIIERLDLDFADGFTALTGETGAGKSILLDALGLLIGQRADTALVRSGEARAEVSGEFDLAADSAAHAWLVAQDLLDPDEPGRLLLRRIIGSDGRTRAFINGQPQNTASLRALGDQLVEIFGQSESQTLLRPEVQRGLLDDFAGAAPARSTVAQAAAALSALDEEERRLREAAGRDPGQLDYLRFQLQELEALAPRAGELAEVEAEHRRLANAGRLLEDGAQALDQLEGEDYSALRRLGGALHLLQGLADLDATFAEAAALADSAQALVQEAADALRRGLERLQLDPERLSELDRRLRSLHDLARKHRVPADELPELLQRLRAQLAESEDTDAALQALARQRADRLKRYHSAADALSAQRQTAARRLAEAASGIVRQLGMANAEFLIQVVPDPARPVRSHGIDEVRFDFSANPGQAPRPLAKVASGGELSRVSLALQVVALSGSAVGTMIFDEVDAGISGAVAEMVGAQLRALGQRRQVLCVTHLAQVAAQAAGHLGIRKEVREGQTYTRVTPLSARARVEELARMQGGADITEAARDHAADLLRRAGQVA